MLQIHVVSKKSLCLAKTKVKILDPGNIQQNKLQIQSETNQTLTMQRKFVFFLEKLKNTLKTLVSVIGYTKKINYFLYGRQNFQKL